MKKRKPNRLKGYDYSKNNLYFITNCVKNNRCCLGEIVHVGTGRDLSVPQLESQSESHPESYSDFNLQSDSKSNPDWNADFRAESDSEFQPDFNSDSNQKSDGNRVFNHESQRSYAIEMVLNQYGVIVEQQINWLSKQYPYVKIHNSQIMPNHFHFILEIDDKDAGDLKIKSVSSLLGALKTTSSKSIHFAGLLDFEWHRSFHDHIIRDEKSYRNIFNYITNNPRNWWNDKFFSKA